ncbi:MAG TPA: succinate dehydrogenase [Paenirhodobacter sp.]
MRAIGVLAALTALAACMGSTGLSPEALARSQAKTVVNSVVAQKMPGVNAAPVTDCVIDNASMSEIYTISKGAVVGVDATTVNTVMTIAKRPDTLNCITKNGLALF